MQHHVIIHKPSVEVSVTWMNARILLWLERTLLYEFLPYTIVGTEIDVFKELSVEHLVNDARGLLALNRDCVLLLCIGDCSNCQENKQ